MRVPKNMTLEEARQRGLVPPEGWTPPAQARLRDAARTCAVAGAVSLHLLRMAVHRWWPTPSTATEEGLAAVGGSFGRTLRLSGVQLEVLHPERVPREGGLVLMWNQESHLDHLVLAAAIPRPFISLYNNEVARFPIYGEVMRAGGHLHVDRTNEAQWRASVERGVARLQAGACVLVSPEGTRSWDGRLLPLKRGAFMLAVGSGKPIVCVTVIGGHRRLPRGSAIVRPGPLRVVFSEPIASAGHEVEAGALQEEVARTFERLKAEHALS